MNRRDFNKSSLLAALASWLPLGWDKTSAPLELPPGMMVPGDVPPEPEPRLIKLPFGLPPLKLGSYNLILGVEYGTHSTLEGALQLSERIFWNNHSLNRLSSYQSKRTVITDRQHGVKISQEKLREITSGENAYVHVYKAHRTYTRNYFCSLGWPYFPINMAFFASNIFLIDDVVRDGWHGVILKSRTSTQQGERFEVRL